MRYDKVSSFPEFPLPHATVHRDRHVHPHTESTRFVRQRLKRATLSQNLTCFTFGATGDRFVIPIIFYHVTCVLLSRFSLLGADSFSTIFLMLGVKIEGGETLSYRIVTTQCAVGLIENCLCPALCNLPENCFQQREII